MPRPWTKPLWTFALFGLLAATAWANAPAPEPDRPQPRPAVTIKKEKPAKVVTSVSVPVTVQKADLKAEGEGLQAKIIISRKVLADLVPDDAPRAAAPQSAAPANEQASISTPGSIIAGISLSLAAVSLVFVVRGKRSARNTAVGVIGVALLLGGVGILSADIRVPGQPYRGPARRPDLDRPPVAPVAVSHVDIVVVEDAEGITLILPK